MKSFFSNCLFLIISTFLISCNDASINKDQLISAKVTQNSVKNLILQDYTTADDSVRVNLEIEKTENDYFSLLIKVNLFGNTWIVSPLEKEYPYGKMTIEIDKNNHFTLIDSINENPKSEYNNDPNWEKLYRVIKNKIVLNQNVKLLTDEDFEVLGHVFFVLEPICTPNELNFKISSKGGILSAEVIE